MRADKIAAAYRAKLQIERCLAEAQKVQTLHLTPATEAQVEEAVRGLVLALNKLRQEHRELIDTSEPCSW